MDYKFLDNLNSIEDLALPNSDKINPFLLKNNQAEIKEALNFIGSDEKFLYLHGFLGTGKRQFINYISDFLDKEVVLLEYYCKASTVCDDILLHFNDVINKRNSSNTFEINTKISTLTVRFQKNISSTKSPFLIVLHTFDDILEENEWLIKETFEKILKYDNVKIIISTTAMKPDVLGGVEEDRKITLKPLSKDIFKEYIESNNLKISEKTLEDFYKYTRGYYYYLALTIKITQAMNTDISDFLLKFGQSGVSFDSYLNNTYLNLVPTTIRNFFWFLRSMRHGLTINALAVFELYDEFSIEYLKNNLIVFQVDETLYVQDYFLQGLEISIPNKTQIKLHKYIIGIYEKQLKEPLVKRAINISRQALRAEIEYHNQCITNIENGLQNSENKVVSAINTNDIELSTEKMSDLSCEKLIELSTNLANDKKYTEAIETCKKILDMENAELSTLIEVRLQLAKLYKITGDYKASLYYYELIETYYKQNKELINLNYLYFDLTELLYKMYKKERAIETIKKVIYSVDTPRSLLVSSCTLLGNIYSDSNNPKDAYNYYKKAIDSLDDTVEKATLAELYFKYALSIDDRGNSDEAFEYYNKCIAVGGNNPYIAFAYSNMASCYFDNETYDEALNCFKKAYEFDKKDNNYDGIYYNASHLAKIAVKNGSKEAINYLLEAKRSAEFLNEEFYILESTIALGDYYYNNPEKWDNCLVEYFKAKNLAKNLSSPIEFAKIERRINDMKLRMKKDTFKEIEEKYDK